MKRKYLKRLGVFCLSAVLLLGTVGCGEENTSDTGTETGEEQQENNVQQGRMQQGGENQLTEEELAAYEEADAIEIEELNLKTNWEEKAQITLGKTIDIDGNGAEVSGDDTVLITEGGAYVISGSLSDGMIQVDTQEEVKLVLSGVSITNSDGAAIYVKSAEACYIETTEGTENVLTDGTAYEETDDEQKGTVFSNDRLVLSGAGTLTVNGNYKHAVCSDDEVYVVSGTYELTAEKDGIHTNNWISVADGSLNIVSTDDGMQSEGPIEIKGGNITIAAEDKGITAYGDLTVTEGTVSISKCTEGLESKNDMTIDGGTIEIVGSDDGLNARTSITINEGTLYVEISAGDAIDSNGTMEINGGLILAFGAQAPEGGIDCDMNEIVINGGTVIGTGGTNSSPSETESSQVSVLLGSASQGDTIGILDSAGNTVFAFEVPKAYSNMLLSVETITSGQEYTVYTGGTIAGDSYHGYYENGTYEGGTESISFTVDGMVVSAGGSSDSMGGFGGGGKKLQNGERPDSSEMPQNGERPELPEGAEMPEDGEMPDGSQMPQNGEMPEDGGMMQKPESEEVPEA